MALGPIICGFTVSNVRTGVVKVIPVVKLDERAARRRAGNLADRWDNAYGSICSIVAPVYA